MRNTLPKLLSNQYSAISFQRATHAIIKQLFLASLLFLCILLTPNPTHAASPTPPPVDTAKAYRQQGQLERLYIVKTFFYSILSDMSCQLVGVKRTNEHVDCMVKDSKTGSLRPLTRSEVLARNYEPGGLIVMSNEAIGALFHKPASGVPYVTALVQNFGIAPKAYAQVDPQTTGVGFQSLSQIQNLFELSRNIVFVLMVVLFVVVGILIMVRFHMDPRTVMTVQNQIPKAVVAIVLISLSYAIAGFLVDAMWVTTYLGINTVAGTRVSCNPDGGAINPDEELPLGAAATAGIIDNPIGFTTDIFGDRTGCFGAFDGISGLSLTVGQTFADMVSSAFLGAVGLDENFGGDCSLANFGNCIQRAIFEIVKFFATIAGFLIIFIAILAALFRLWFMLLKNYIMLLLDIILGPFVIMLGLIPSSSYGFGKWIRSIVAQLAVFPAAAILLVMASVIASDPAVNTPGSGAFVPPLIGNPNIADNMGAIIAFGFILVAPNLLETLREALQAPASKQSGLVTAGLAAAFGRVSGVGRGAGERMNQRNEAVGEFSSEHETGIKYVKRGFGKVPFTKWRPGGSGA